MRALNGTFSLPSADINDSHRLMCYAVVRGLLPDFGGLIRQKGGTEWLTKMDPRFQQ